MKKFIGLFLLSIVLVAGCTSNQKDRFQEIEDVTKEGEEFILEQQRQMAMNFVIESAYCDPSKNEIIFSIRNTGEGTIESVSSYVNDELMDNDSDSLTEGSGKTFSIEDVDCGEVVGKIIKIVMPSGLFKTRIIE